MRCIGLCALGLLIVGTVGGAAEALQPSDVIAYFPFGDAAGTVFADAGPNGNDATFYRPLVFNELPAIDLQYATVPGVTFGETSGNGLALGTRSVDGVNHQLMVGLPLDSPLPGPGDSFAVSFWLNLSSWTTLQGIVASYHYNGLQWTIGQHSSEDALLAWSSEGDAIAGTDVFEASTASLTPNSYSHFVVQYEGTSGVTAVYVNGAAATDGGATSPFYGNDDPGFILGGRVTASRDFTTMPSLLDDFAIVSGVVSATDVGKIMSNGAANSGLSLLAHYAMEEVAGSTIVDSSGHGNSGTLVGFDPVSGGAAPRDVGVAAVPGMFGEAARFLNVWKQHARIETPTDMPSPGEAFTAVFWVRSDDWINTNSLIASENLNNFAFTIGLHTNMDGMLFRTTNDSGKGVALTSLAPGEFAHFAVVIDSTGQIAAVYVNGDSSTLVAKGGWDLPDAGTSTLAARIRNGSTAYAFNGDLDDFALIRGALTEAEVERIMQVGVAAAVPEPSTLILLTMGGLLILRRRFRRRQ